MKRDLAIRKEERVGFAIRGGGKERRRLTTRNLAVAIMPIFKQHIGRSNAISKQELFKRVFGKKYDDNNLADYMRWEFMRRAMHTLRQQSNCFVVGGYNEYAERYEYFVVQSYEDAEIYTGILDNAMKRMRSMQKRAVVAVEEEWHAKEWVLPGRKSGVPENVVTLKQQGFTAKNSTTIAAHERHTRKHKKAEV